MYTNIFLCIDKIDASTASLGNDKFVVNVLLMFHSLTSTGASTKLYDREGLLPKEVYGIR